MSKNILPFEGPGLRKLRRALLAWYDQHRRELPWRRNTDPYRVWVSEIMLQQTRVAAVLDHYARFMQRFPDVRVLAAVRESSVLAVWSGLGYYHRARRMHQAAKVVVRERRGKFPQSAAGWLELPGIGRYTAAAIASIAFGESVAVVDGNVERVLGRIAGANPGREAAWQRAEAVLDRRRPGDFNQAMMELGATICTPRAPQCLLCPLYTWCVSRGAEASRPQPPRKRKELHYALARENGAVLLMQRAADAPIMAGMWELPIIQDDQRNGDKPLAKLKHSITDTDYEVTVLPVSAERSHGITADGRWFTRKRWERLALTGLTRKILRRLALEPSAVSSESK
ncbi:MAG: A/G-specific adenine glycosylase [Acidobacteriota bacterium]|nr:A/G-specific adenine glycosylase [Acidobacteriota bacterium]